jgi:hypothetical protein
MASSAEKHIAFALLFFKIERFAREMPTLFANPERYFGQP